METIQRSRPEEAIFALLTDPSAEPFQLLSAFVQAAMAAGHASRLETDGRPIIMLAHRDQKMGHMLLLIDDRGQTPQVTLYYQKPGSDQTSSENDPQLIIPFIAANARFDPLDSGDHGC